MDIKNHFKIATSALTILVAGVLIQSCKVDERYSYDKIENVNTDVTVFEDGLSIPLIQSTCKISVDSILSLSGINGTSFGEYLKVDENGGYYLSHEEDFSFTDAIDELDLSNVLNISPVECSQKISCNINLGVDIPEGVNQSITVDELSIDLDENVEFSIIDAEDIPEMVKSIGIINLDGTKAEVQVSFDNLPDIGDGEYKVDLTAALPSFITPSAIAVAGTLENGKISRVIDIQEFDFSEEDLDLLRQQKSQIKEELNVKGTVKAENATVSAAALKNSVSGKIVAKVSGENNSIKVNSLKASIDYKVEKDIEIPFFNLSETLQDYVLDLPEAVVTAKVTSNTAVPMSAEIDLNEGLYTLPLYFPYSADPSKTELCINGYSLDINPLVAAEKDEIPAKFNISVSPDKESYIFPDADYTMNVNFGFNIPVQLGEEFHITYADTVALEKDADFIKTLLEQTSACISGKSENTLPFSVDVKLELLKYDKASDSYQVIDTGEQCPTASIPAAAESEFTFTLEASPKADLTGLSHLRFSFTLGANGALLNKDNYILFKQMSLSVPKGVTLNLSDLFE